MGLRILSALGGVVRAGIANTFTAAQTFYRAGSTGAPLVLKTDMNDGDWLSLRDANAQQWEVYKRGSGTSVVFYAAQAGADILELASTGVILHTGVGPNGSGLKHARVTTGSIGGASTALVTVAWTTAFADANYTVFAAVQDATATSLSLSVVHVETKTAAAVAVRVLNNAAGALTGTLQVIAVHD